jgi:hypothetical protein
VYFTSVKEEVLKVMYDAVLRIFGLMPRKDVRADDLLSWNEYTNKAAATALPIIYNHAVSVSKAKREWYWKSIKSNRRASIFILLLTLFLLILGTILPILAGLGDMPEVRLRYTQIGVVALACAGLLQVSDRVFGWSSGWLRYITTVTAMENLTHKFELDWAGYVVAKRNVADDDIKTMFELAKQFEDSVSKLQSDETATWVTEFGSGVVLLGELIKTQRDSAEKTAVSARSILDVQQKDAQKGAVEMKIVHKTAPVALDIALDNQFTESFIGSTWAKAELIPGQHIINVTPQGATGPTIRKVVIVSPGGVAQAEVNLC